jgi:hypothetical protein
MAGQEHTRSLLSILTDQAPELFKKTAMFTKKADVYAAGIVFLELISLKPPSLILYDEMWPKIVSVGLPDALNKILSGILGEDPDNRLLFPAILDLLQSSGGLQIRGLTYEGLSDEYVELIAYLRDDDADFGSSSNSGRVFSHRVLRRP